MALFLPLLVLPAVFGQTYYYQYFEDSPQCGFNEWTTTGTYPTYGSKYTETESSSYDYEYLICTAYTIGVCFANYDIYNNTVYYLALQNDYEVTIHMYGANDNDCQGVPTSYAYTLDQCK